MWGGSGGKCSIGVDVFYSGSSLESGPLHSLLISPTWSSHIHTHCIDKKQTDTHILVDRDCITLTLTAAGLSFINVSFSGVICWALYRAVIIQVIRWKSDMVQEMGPADAWRAVFFSLLHIKRPHVHNVLFTCTENRPTVIPTMSAQLLINKHHSSNRRYYSNFWNTWTGSSTRTIHPVNGITRVPGWRANNGGGKLEIPGMLHSKRVGEEIMIEKCGLSQ